jgi:hypothetical protein
MVHLAFGCPSYRLRPLSRWADISVCVAPMPRHMWKEEIFCVTRATAIRGQPREEDVWHANHLLMQSLFYGASSRRISRLQAIGFNTQHPECSCWQPSVVCFAFVHRNLLLLSSFTPATTAIGPAFSLLSLATFSSLRPPAGNLALR